MKLLIKKKNGSVHIREKSNESGANLEEVHPNKIRSWLALSEASRSAHGGTMEDIINRVREEMEGAIFKEEKQKIEVTEEEYHDLLFQAANKEISKRTLDSIVTIKKKSHSEKLLTA